MAKIEITKEQFTAYVRVQKSGVTNMFDIRNVTALTGLNGWIGYIFAIGFILYLLRYPILFIISLFY